MIECRKTKRQEGINMKKSILTILIVMLVCISIVAMVACGGTSTEPFDNKTVTKQFKAGFQNATMGKDYVESFSNFKAIGYTSATMAVQDLINGRIDYVVTDKAPANTIASKFSSKVKVINVNLTEEEYALGVDKNNANLLAQVNEFLQKNEKEIGELATSYIEGTNTPKVIKNGNKNAENVLIVATNAEFAPFEYTNQDGFSGIDIEIMAMFCEQYNYTLYIENMAFEAVVTSVQTGKADIAAAALTVTEDRAKQVSFSSAYYSASQVIIALKNDTTFDGCTTKEQIEDIFGKLGNSANFVQSSGEAK